MPHQKRSYRTRIILGLEPHGPLDILEAGERIPALRTIRRAAEEVFLHTGMKRPELFEAHS